MNRTKALKMRNALLLGLTGVLVVAVNTFGLTSWPQA